MKKLLLFVITAMVLVSCKTEETQPAPELAQKIVGTYTLAKVYKGTTTLTGATGSAVITAIDNSTASIKYLVKYGNSTQDITNNYTVVADGSNYTLKIGNSTSGTVMGNTLTLSAIVAVGTTIDTYSVDFTK